MPNGEVGFGRDHEIFQGGGDPHRVEGTLPSFEGHPGHPASPHLPSHTNLGVTAPSKPAPKPAPTTGSEYAKAHPGQIEQDQMDNDAADEHLDEARSREERYDRSLDDAMESSGQGRSMFGTTEPVSGVATRDGGTDVPALAAKAASDAQDQMRARTGLGTQEPAMAPNVPEKP